jgi:threonine/homoserine/homoserine lactone efflux protein
MIWAFIGVVCVWSITPGPITILIINNAWSINREAGWLTALGGCIAIGMYTLASLLMGSIIPNESIWVNILKGSGAAYFALLGFLYVKQGLNNKQQLDPALQKSPSANHQSLVTGFCLGIFSPQLALFYLVLIPQTEFNIDLAAQELIVVLVGIVHFAVRISWYSLLIFLTHPLRNLLIKGPMERTMRLAVGSIFLMLSGQILAG